MGTDDRKPLDGALLLTSQIILTIVTIPAFIPRPAQVIALAVAGWYFYRVIVTQTTGEFNIDAVLGSGILIQYTLALDYALLTPPEKLRDFHDNDRTRVTQRPLKQRLIWALKLISNPRGIGWAHAPSYLPPQPSPSTPRSRFVFSRILLTTCCFLIVYGTGILDATTADKLIAGAPLHRRALGVLSFGLGLICGISGVHTFFSAGIVGCGLSSPERWPLLFGSPLQVWSIKRFWRRFWHQLIRRPVLTCTSSILGCVFPANYVGTTSYKLARLYIAFCISGLVHIGGEVMATGKPGFKAFTFFMLQPLGITIELAVSYLWHRLQDRTSNPQKTTVNGSTMNIERAQQNQIDGRLSDKNGKSLVEEPIPPVWIRCVGSIWLTFWLVWTAAPMIDASFSKRLLSVKRGQI